MNTSIPNFNSEYLGPYTTIMDWVAGGNFDGYVFRNTLKFIEQDQKVILRTEIILSFTFSF